MNSLHYKLEDSNFDFRHVSLCDLDIPQEKMVEPFVNSGDPDQKPRLGSALFAIYPFRGL